MIRAGASSVNYLDDRLLASYFEAREHETYYRSLKHVGPRRDFHEVIVPVLMDLVGEILSASSTQMLDTILATPIKPRDRVDDATAPAEEAKRLHPTGFDLLGIGGRLDFEMLKASYRRSALRCHPDRGGSHEQMILVNEAYSLFHEMLCRRQMAGVAEVAGAEELGIGFGVPIRTAKDYMYVAGLLLLNIKLDEWSLDDAHYWVTMLASDDWMTSDYARNVQVRSTLLFACSSLAGSLWAAELREQAREVYKVAEQALRVVIAGGLNLGNVLSEADKYIKQGQKLRIVLNHHRQADNALRLGLIDKKRYKQTVERLDGKRAVADSREEALGRFLSEIGFLRDLPTDRVAQGKIVRARLVPEPGYFNDRLEDLTDDQQAEYLRAYGLGCDLSLVVKYALVRLTSLLRSMIVHAEEVGLDSIERECRFLAGISGNSTGDAFSQVADVARFLNALDLDRRRTRLDILRQLDEKSSDGGVNTITLDLSTGAMQSSLNDPSFRARPTTSYFDRVRLPLDRLRLALRTGSAKTRQEEAEEREVWNREITLVNSLRAGEDYRAAWDALDRAKDDPEGVVIFAAPYVEKLLEHGKGMVLVEHLGIGYWIDKLTIALTRLKRWDEAMAWLDRYFTLPERYQKGSSPSEQDSMRKRLERCRKMQAR